MTQVAHQISLFLLGDGRFSHNDSHLPCLCSGLLRVWSAFFSAYLRSIGERAELVPSDERRLQLIRFTAYNLETRYPEDRLLLRDRYSKPFTETEMRLIQEVASWLKRELQQERKAEGMVQNTTWIDLH